MIFIWKVNTTHKASIHLAPLTDKKKFDVTHHRRLLEKRMPLIRVLHICSVQFKLVPRSFRVHRRSHEKQIVYTSILFAFSNLSFTQKQHLCVNYLIEDNLECKYVNIDTYSLPLPTSKQWSRLGYLMEVTMAYERYWGNSGAVLQTTCK